MLKPIKHSTDNKKSETLACLHWKVFPPPAALMANHAGESLDDHWKAGHLEVTKYQSAKVWEKICGKVKMDNTCLDCDFVRRVEVRNQVPCLVTLDGTHSIPQIDLPNLEFMGRRPAILADKDKRAKNSE